MERETELTEPDEHPEEEGIEQTETPYEDTSEGLEESELVEDIEPSEELLPEE